MKKWNSILAQRGVLKIRTNYFKKIVGGMPKTYFKCLSFLIFALIYSIPIIFGFFFIERFAVNVPYWDPWSHVVPWTTAYHEGNLDISELFKQQNDSRPIISNFIMLSISLITNLNIKTMFFIGYCIFIISIFIIIYLLKNEINLNVTTMILLIPFFYYPFNPFFLVRFIDNVGSLFYPIMIFFAIMAIIFLDKSKNFDKNFIISIGMGIACTFSFAAGLAIWFAGFVQLLLQKMERKLERIIVWLLFSILTVYINYVYLEFSEEGLHSTGAIIIFLSTTLTHPIQKILFLIGTFGAQMINDRNIALFFGLVFLGITISMLINNRKFLEFNRYSKWYGLLTFGLITSILVTFARSGSSLYHGYSNTIFFIPEIRHSLAIFLPIVCVYALTIIYTNNSLLKDISPKDDLNNQNEIIHRREYTNIFLLGMLFTLMIMGYLLHIPPGLNAGENSYSKLIDKQNILFNYKNTPDIEFEKLYFDVSQVKIQAEKLERLHLSVFTNKNYADRFDG